MSQIREFSAGQIKLDYDGAILFRCFDAQFLCFLNTPNLQNENILLARQEANNFVLPNERNCLFLHLPGLAETRQKTQQCTEIGRLMNKSRGKFDAHVFLAKTLVTRTAYVLMQRVFLIGPSNLCVMHGERYSTARQLMFLSGARL